MFNYGLAFFQVMRHARLSEEQLAKHVHRRLREVLVNAYDHVPYYRDLMQDIGYNPHRDYRGPGDLQHFPVTTRAELKRNGTEGFIKQGCDLSSCFVDATSGSTGIPLKVYRSQYERSIIIAKWLRVLFLNGYSIREKVMSLTAPERLKYGRSFLQSLGLLRRKAVNYFLPPAEVVDLLLDYRPHVLYGNRSHLDNVAIELIRRRSKLTDLKLVVVGAEIISSNTRKLYQTAFGVDPVESYGSVEMGAMAHETPDRKGLRLCRDTTYFEFLDSNNRPVASGQPGRVIVTDLYGMTMPLIRYDQGDLAIFRQSPTGTERRITRLIGRENDAIVLPDGSKLPFYAFHKVFSRFDQVRQFRVIQKTTSHFQIIVAAESGYLDQVSNTIISSLQEKIPAQCSFELLRVDSIDPDPQGKLRIFISEVKQ